MIRFHGDDDGYLAWRATNPLGFVVNYDEVGYARLHRANCRQLDKKPPGFKSWTENYPKLCSTRFSDVEGRGVECFFCNPSLIVKG